MFLDGLPGNYDYNKLFDVFLFYLEQCKEKTWLNQDYPETKRRAYIKEEIARARGNLDKGRAKQNQYIKTVQKFSSGANVITYGVEE